ncbi:phage tail sheath family protein [uncultured Clostridium sp.]|uniref:phage tail sheath family protein n=1 Tax=uncultured Clostridium sp. TaxID=59620 RepID=UPI002634D68C|nr:phage tail sheath family protein [uncultured Clostridium sp.]
MALGGGTFVAQNKKLPGSYINFVSKARANSSLSDRGFATIPLELDWGKDGEVFTVTSADFEKKCLSIFGYENTDEKMKGLRDLFINASTLYAYRLNSGEKASNDYATAKCSGSRGNDLKVIISKDADDTTKYVVNLYLGTIKVDSQTVKTATELVENDFVTYKTDATLAATAGTPLTGGTNGTVNGASYQSYFDKIESYSFNVMGIVSTDTSIKTLAVNFCKRLRDEIGAKFQVVLHNKEADYEGVINVVNNTTPELVYWVTGAEAGCAINKSCLNKKYDGEYEVDTDYTQTQLENAIDEGKFVLHAVNSDVRVLKDINSLTTISDDKGEIFKDNQTIRVVDQIANDIANLFNTKYLGSIPNDQSGRISLWNDIVQHHESLQTMRAIQDFDSDNIEVAQGNDKSSVIVTDVVTIVNTMAQLYMTVTIN